METVVTVHKTWNDDDRDLTSLKLNVNSGNEPDEGDVFIPINVILKDYYKDICPYEQYGFEYIVPQSKKTNTHVQYVSSVKPCNTFDYNTPENSNVSNTNESDVDNEDDMCEEDSHGQHHPPDESNPDILDNIMYKHTMYS